MAARQHHIRREVIGLSEVIDFQVDGDTSYVTGGYSLPIPLAQLGIQNVYLVEVFPTSVVQDYVWDYTNQKLIFGNGAGVEAVNGTDQSARTNIRVRAWGSREALSP